MDVDRTYLYKISRNGVYLGLLPNVVSDFSYKQEINTGAVQTQIDVNQSLDTADEAPPILTAEDGSWLTTENGIPITTERSVEVIGNKDSNRLIAGFNDIEIVEISSDHPNGVTVFTGYMSKWSASAGSADITSITCISYGKDLSDYIYGTNIYTLQETQTTQNEVWYGSYGSYAPLQAQSFIPLSSYSLTKVVLKMAAGDGNGNVVPSANIEMNLYSGTVNGAHTLLATATVQITSQYPTLADAEFIFPTASSLTSGQSYFFAWTGDNYHTVGITLGSGPDLYANGSFWLAKTDYTQIIGPFTTQDAYFRIYSSTSIVSDAQFTGVDPGNMVKQAVDGYRSQGGIVAYTSPTVDLAGYTLNYSFKLATILEIINKARELAPFDWYWYVDPGTQTLYFKETLTTATHKMIISRHVESFNIEASVEEIINVVYFSGGPTAGVNLLKLYTNNPSLVLNRRGMNRLTDNRVTDATTASTLGQANINENNAEIFRTSPLIINANTYDISLIKLGDTLAFEGFGSFVDSLIFQITGIDRHADYIGLTLGKLPLRSDFYVDQIRRDLDDQATLANPTAPS